MKTTKIPVEIILDFTEAKKSECLMLDFDDVEIEPVSAEMFALTGSVVLKTLIDTTPLNIDPDNIECEVSDNGDLKMVVDDMDAQIRVHFYTIKAGKWRPYNG